MTPTALVAAPPVDDGTRRELLAAGLALSLGLAACGEDDGAGGATGAPGDGFPVTIRHHFGTTTFASAPERVVALDAAGLLDPVLALGVRPVGAAQVAKGRFPTVLRGRTDGIEPVGVVITDADGGNFFLSGPRYDTSALLERAGMDVLTLEDPAEDFGNGVIAVSDERLGELDADHLVVVTYEPDPAKRVNAFEQNPLWPRLRAVRAGDAHVIDGSTWNNFGPIAIVAMLREAVDLFAGR